MTVALAKTFRNIPIKSGEIISQLGDYKAPSMKIQNMERAKEIIRLKKGMFIVNGSDYGFPISKPICSNHIYGPSYLSLQWALSYYGLIPERVYMVTAVTIKRSRKFENELGVFSYRQVPEDYYPIGITIEEHDGTNILIATPEKALCDMILADPYIPNDSIEGLYRYLEEDIRFDIDELAKFNIQIIEECAKCGRKTRILNNLIKIINKI